MSKTLTLSEAISESLSTPVDPQEAEKRETLVRALSDVLLNERLPAKILIPGVESEAVGPHRKITMSIIRVLAHRGFVITDDKLQATVAERLGTDMPPTPNIPVAAPAPKPLISAAWQALPEVGTLPVVSFVDTPSVRGLEAIR